MRPARPGHVSPFVAGPGRRNRQCFGHGARPSDDHDPGRAAAVTAGEAMSPRTRCTGGPSRGFRRDGPPSARHPWGPGGSRRCDSRGSEGGRPGRAPVTYPTPETTNGDLNYRTPPFDKVRRLEPWEIEQLRRFGRHASTRTLGRPCLERPGPLTTRRDHHHEGRNQAVPPGDRRAAAPRRDGTDLAAVRTSTEALRGAAADREDSRDETRDRRLTPADARQHARGASSAEVLHTGIVDDPAAAAGDLRHATDTMAKAAQPAHASVQPRGTSS